jgi:cysteine desulfurase
VLGLVTDHKAELSPLRRLAEAGFALTLLQPDAQGLLSPQVLAAALGEGAQLVSLVHVNSETGVMQDLPALAAVCRERGVALHIDAAQSAGKLPLSVEGIDYLSFTAHKLGGPQGIGALYVAPQRRVALQAQILGGGQQRGLRSGTLPTHQIVAFGLACHLAAARQPELATRLTALRQRLWQGLADLPGVLHNGHPQHCVPGILNLSFTGVEGESLVSGLVELALSTGSACNSSSGEPSPVLRALGRDTQLAQASLRMSLGATSTEQDVDTAIAAVRRAHTHSRNTIPPRSSPSLK